MASGLELRIGEERLQRVDDGDGYVGALERLQLLRAIAGEEIGGDWERALCHLQSAGASGAHRPPDPGHRRDPGLSEER